MQTSDEQYQTEAPASDAQVRLIIRKMVLNLRGCGTEKLSGAERDKLGDYFMALAKNQYEAGLQIGRQEGRLEQLEYINALIEAAQNPKSDA